MNNTFEKLGHSLIHHGKTSNRIYLIKFNWKDQANLFQELDTLAARESYSKIIAKVPAKAIPLFLTNDYLIEASIPGYFNGLEDLFFMAKYFSETRGAKPLPVLAGFASQLSKERALPDRDDLNPDPSFSLSALDESFAEEISCIYKKVFATYPFPIHQPQYILETMNQGTVRYFGVHKEEKLIGLASSEIDHVNKNAEMTDFAVLPEYRGHQLAYSLLIKMEQEMARIGIKTTYTIARLKSIGMNKTFLRAGYQYSGLLINNTNISGNIESMNVYYKPLEICAK
jgi:lysine 2,3-aminomutase